MLKACWVLMSAFISFSALAEVSLIEKQNRVEFLEELGQKTSMNIEAYRRELEYEKKELPLDKRAENEARLLAEKIKVQVQKSFEAALQNKSVEEAEIEVKAAIAKDLQLIAPELREEIQALSLQALAEAQAGGINSEANLTHIKEVLLKGVTDRSDFLNQESDYQLPPLHLGKDLGPDEMSYNSKAEILNSLVSNGNSIRWVAASNISIKTEAIVKKESKIKIQLKAEFLGVEIEAGPIITFSRSASSGVSIGSETLHPVLLPDGNFDFSKRDNTGKVIYLNGKPQRRFINFTCDTTLHFQSEYSGEGGFRILGIGGSHEVSKKLSNQVELNSRRILIPEYIDGKSVTLTYIRNLCHEDFYNAHITSNMTVADSLKIMMKNVISGLRFSHPKTQCATDQHCTKWFNQNVMALGQLKNVPRCVEESREKYFACDLRGLTGQNCTVFDSQGKRISDGNFEFACDKGLQCVKVQNNGWFSNWSVYRYAKGKCMPINSNTYQAP